MRTTLPFSFLLMAALFATAAIGKSGAATRVALAGGESNGGLENVLDTATALLGKDADLQLLDRAEVGRVLREHELSLAGLEGAEHAVKAGQLLQADLFAVLEGTLTNEVGGSTSLGLVVFDAKTGVRYADLALLASNTVSAASATAEAVRAAIAKSRRSPENLHTVGLLLVRNADMPRQFDGLCDAAGLLLEREWTASPGIAVLERRRLEQVTQERRVAPDAEGNRLLSSLRMIELDIGRDGEGLRGTLALVGEDGVRSEAITASVPTRDAATLAHLLADKTERFLNVPTDGLQPNRTAEAFRFHRGYLLLYQHRDYFAAVRALDAAIALAPDQTSWRREMALLLPFAAIELVDPGGQNWQRALAAQPSAADLSSCLALGRRGADLLLDLSREAAETAKPGGPIPESLQGAYRDRLCQLLQKLADVKTTDLASATEIAVLQGKERTLRMEIMEPFLLKQSVDQTSFAAYSRALWLWFNFGLYRSTLSVEERRQDEVQALRHWVAVSHKFNPPDGSGLYTPLSLFPGADPSGWYHDEEFRRTLEQDPDPVIRFYARASRVAASMQPTGYPADGTLAAERDFRLYAQDLLTRGEASKPGPFRNHVWQTIQRNLERLLNDDKGWQEYLETCRFAFAQGDIQPNLFYSAFFALDDRRHRKAPEELEAVTGALKLILDKPEAYPDTNTTFRKRGDVIKDLQQRRDQLKSELAGVVRNIPAPSPWKQKGCLLDLAAPINGLAWLFKPVVQDGQVYAAALGFHEWGLPEDSLQLARVPLEGGAPSFLGRANIAGIDWPNRPYVLARGPKSRLTDFAANLDVERAACFGAGCYFAGTGSGVFIFPTNGGPVLHLGVTNGLPSEDIQAVAFLEGKLYIGAGEVEHNGYLATYEPASGRIVILASSRRGERLSPFDDQPPFYTLCLAADTLRHRLVMAVSTVIIPNNKLPDITPGMGIWSYLPLTGEYKRLAPLRLVTMSAMLMRVQTWAGLADANTLTVKGVSGMALFDLRSDRLLSVSFHLADHTNATMTPWQTPTPGNPGQFTAANGPFLLCDGWFYAARPFERKPWPDGSTEQFPPLRTDYSFEPREALQLLDDGKHLLAADQFSLWLLELSPEPARAPVELDTDLRPGPSSGRPGPGSARPSRLGRP